MFGLKGLLAAVVILVLATGVAAVTLGDLIRRWIRFHFARSWVEGKGRILESYLYSDPQRESITRFRVVYEFEAFSGEVVVGTTPRLCGEWFWGRRGLQKFVERFPVGMPVTVFYDPAAPRRNCLDRDDRGSFVAQLCIIGFMASVALAISFSLWYGMSG